MNGRVTWDDKAHRFASTINMECNKGYQLVGSPEQICLQNSHWSDTDHDEHCERKNRSKSASKQRPEAKSNSFKGMACPLLEPFHDGIMKVSDLYVNTTVTYTCDPGFMLTDGTKTRTCQSNLKWSGQAPTCRSE